LTPNSLMSHITTFLTLTSKCISYILVKFDGFQLLSHMMISFLFLIMRLYFCEFVVFVRSDKLSELET